MKFEIKRQESNSRGELLLRTLFGYFYIAIPHMFVLYWLMIGSAFCSFIAWWSILFTGKYPKGMFEYQVKVQRWSMRVSARLLNMVDGYPAFGLEAQDEKIVLEVPYPESLKRGDLILKTLFGYFYVLIPHGIVLYFVMIGASFVSFFAWWAILFTGKYPQGMFDYMVKAQRWALRLSMYFGLWMSDKYPPFNGRPDEEQN